MSTHGVLPDNSSGSSSSSAPLMPAFNPGESVFAVDTSKLNQALSWVIHSTKKHSVDIDDVKRETAGLLAQQRLAAAAPPPAAAASDALLQEFETRFQGILKGHASLNEALQLQVQELVVVKQTLQKLSDAPPPPPSLLPAADAQTNTASLAPPPTLLPPSTPKDLHDFVRLPAFAEALNDINELRSDLRKHSRFMVKVSERTGLQAAASQFERMVIRSKLKQFESKQTASPDATVSQVADGSSAVMAAYVRGLTKSSKRNKGAPVGRDADGSTPKSQPATPGAGSHAGPLQEVEALVKLEVPGELQLHSDAEQEGGEGAAGDARYLVAISEGLTPDEVAAASEGGRDAFSSVAASREQSSSRGGSRHGLRSQVLSIQDDAESQTESGDGGSISGGFGVHISNFDSYQQRLDELQGALERAQHTADDAITRVCGLESGLLAVQQHVLDIEAAQQRYSRPASAASHEFAIPTQSPRSQASEDLLVVTSQSLDPVDAGHNDNVIQAVTSPLKTIPEGQTSLAGAALKVTISNVSENQSPHPSHPSSPAPAAAATAAAATAAASPASSVHSRRASLHAITHSKEFSDKSREMFLDRPEDRALKEKKRAEELAQFVPLQDFLAVKAEAEATKKALTSAEILLKQLAVRVTSLEETCAPKAAITVLEGNTSKRIVGLEGRLRTLSSILSAKADSMTVDAVSASVEANAAGLVQLKERLENVLQTDSDDKDASDYLVLLSSVNRLKHEISVMESRLASELKDIKATVDHSNSSVRVLQTTFAAEKLRKLNRQKSPQGRNGAQSSTDSLATKTVSLAHAHASTTQGMVSESGHVITNAAPGVLSSSPSASRPRPRDVEGSISVGYKGGSLSIPENAASLKLNTSWPNEMTQEQATVAAHAAAAVAPSTVAAATGDSVSSVLHDDAFANPSSPSLFHILNGAKSAPPKHAAAALKVHQPLFPPDYELSGLPPPTRQKVSVPMSSPLLPQLAEGRQGAVGDRKKEVHVKF